ncbi:signal peptide protein, partial [Micrococcus yunnanensis]
MQSSPLRSTRRRIGALVAGAVLAGGTLTSSPALAAPSG